MMVNKTDVTPNEVSIEMKGECVERVQEIVYLGRLMTNTVSIY